MFLLAHRKVLYTYPYPVVQPNPNPNASNPVIAPQWKTHLRLLLLQWAVCPAFTLKCLVSSEPFSCSEGSQCECHCSGLTGRRKEIFPTVHSSSLTGLGLPASYCRTTGPPCPLHPAELLVQCSNALYSAALSRGLKTLPVLSVVCATCWRTCYNGSQCSGALPHNVARVALESRLMVACSSTMHCYSVLWDVAHCIEM